MKAGDPIGKNHEEKHKCDGMGEGTGSVIEKKAPRRDLLVHSEGLKGKRDKIGMRSSNRYRSTDSIEKARGRGKDSICWSYSSQGNGKMA